ncbi:MAG: HEAT repeat domain-containing protein [Polyangia bacterium]
MFLLDEAGHPDLVKIVDFGLARALLEGEDDGGLRTPDLSLAESPGPAAPDKTLGASPSPSERRASASLSGSGETLSDTTPGSLVGTPRYMAPEQTLRAASDERADQYALGCILYEMLSGGPPFRAQALKQLLTQHRSEPVTPLHERVPGLVVRAELEELVQRMLAKRPEARLPSMAAVVQALEAELVPEPTPPPPRLEPAPPAPRPERPRGRWLAGTLLGGLALLGGAGWFWARTLRPRPVEHVAPQPALDLAAARTAALRVLEELLASPTPWLRRDALSVVGTAQELSLLPAVTQALRDTDEEVRAQAALTLGQLGANEQRGALRELARAETPSGSGLSVRAAALAALLRLGDSEAEQELRRDLAGTDAESRQRAAFALAGRSNPQALALLAAAASARPEADAGAVVLWGRLLQAGEPAAQARLAALLTSEAPLSLRIAAAGQLAERGVPQGRRFLRELAERPGPEQLTAARLLAAPDQPELAPRFRALVADRQATVAARLLAVEGLGRSGSVEDARLLLPLLAPPTEPRLRLAAASGVLALLLTDPRGASEQSLRHAQAAVHSDSWLARREAAELLGAAPTAEAVPLLSALLQDRVAEVRRSAVRSLAAQGSEAALRSLRQGLRDPEPEVRREALHAVAQAGELLLARGVRWVLGEVKEWTQELVTAGTPVEQVAARGLLLRLGDGTQLAPLLEQLRSQEESVRRAVVAESGDHRELLRLALGDRVTAIRQLAAERLALQGDRGGVPLLVQALGQGGSAAVRAYALLARLGEEVAPPPALTEGLRSGDPETLQAVTVLPPARALLLLKEAALAPDHAARRQVLAALSDSLELARTPDGQALLRRLVRDDDAGVQRQALGLVARVHRGLDLAAPTTSPPAPPAPPVRPPAVDPLPPRPVDSPSPAVPPQPGAASLVLRDAVTTAPAARRGRPVRIDGRPWQLLSSQPLELPAGRHVVTTLLGKQTVEAQAGRSVTLDLPLSPVEQTVHRGLEAFARGDTDAAQRHLEKANGLCGRDRGQAPACALLMADGMLRLGRLYEDTQRYLDAMSLYESVLRSAGTSGLPPPTRRELTAAAARVAPRLGRVLVPVRTGAACTEVLRWMNPGEQSLVLRGATQTVRVQAGTVVRAGSCAD